MLPWFTRDFMSATRGWSVTARGVYRELLDAQWDMGQLPIEPIELATTIAATPEEWAKGWVKCESKFPVIDGIYRQNAKLEEHRSKAYSLQDVRVEIGRLGGQASAKARAQAIATPKGAATVNHPSPSPSPSPSEGSFKVSESPTSAPVEGSGEKKRAAPFVVPATVNPEAWAEWIAWRRRKKYPQDPITLKKHTDLLGRHTFGIQQAMVDKSINGNWQGLFELKPGDLQNIKPKIRAKSSAELIAERGPDAE